MSPYRFSPGTLSVPELMAARLDGDLVDCGGVWVPAALADTPWLRAHAVAPLVSPGLAVVGPTAAWVHGALAVRPRVLDVRRATARRRRPPPIPGVVYHDARIDDADIAPVAGVLVSHPARVVVDLLRLRSADAAVTARRMLDDDLSLATAVLAWLHAHPGAPGTRALRVALATDQEEVTR